MPLIQIRCVGKSPLLMDRMSDETLEELRTGVRAPKIKDRPVDEVSVEKIYRENGPGSRIGIPVEMMFSCLVNAGRNVKNGKKQLSTASTTTLPDLMTIQDTFLPFTNIEPKKEKDYWKTDRRRGRLDNGIAICVVRPRFDHWEFLVTIAYEKGKINPEVLRQLFQNAGSTQGLGSFRPNCKGPFGRFEVKEWVELEERAAA